MKYIFIFCLHFNWTFIHLHLRHLVDAFIQSKDKEKQQYIAVQVPSTYTC